MITHKAITKHGVVDLHDLNRRVADHTVRQVGFIMDSLFNRAHDVAEPEDQYPEDDAYCGGDYPLGGMEEPYDIMRDMELMNE